MSYTNEKRHMDNIPRNCHPADSNVPIAWRHREMTLNQNNPYARRTSSPSMTSSSSDDREEVPIVRHHYRPLSRHSNADRREQHLDHYATIRNERFSSARSDRMDSYAHRNTPPAENYFYRNSGTLRSTRSVPSLAFAAAMEVPDPCPVHGGNHGLARRHGSLFDIRSPPLGGPLSLSGLDKKNFYGSKHSMVNGYPPPFQFHPDMPQYLPPPPMINPMMRPPPHHPMPMLMDQISLRDPFNKSMTFQRNGANGYPTKEPVDPYRVEQVCCKGHLIVLWIILGVVTVGVILGIIMGVTIT